MMADIMKTFPTLPITASEASISSLTTRDQSDDRVTGDTFKLPSATSLVSRSDSTSAKVLKPMCDAAVVVAVVIVNVVLAVTFIFKPVATFKNNTARQF